MITTIVLVQADPKGIPACATALTAIEGVAEVYSVSGAWDLVAIVRVPDLEQIAIPEITVKFKKLFLKVRIHLELTPR
jgi:DNA-binding Lrp family transcriptional regulator